jgi:hypothetical protein
LGELARYLQVKELSTPSHAVRRAEERMKKRPGLCPSASASVENLRPFIYTSLTLEHC